MVFMISGIKETVPIVIKAVPETTFNGEWLSNHLNSCLSSLIDAGFSVRGIVMDNHSANVNAFEKLCSQYGDSNLPYITFPGSKVKTYLFFDTVHLLKNIRNNLLNRKKFVFPGFNFESAYINISSEPGYISWRNLYQIYDDDKKLTANLRKAPKLTYKVLHPGNNKQNVELALSIFHESTIAACENYLPNRPDIAFFLKLIHNWWNISNSKQQFTSNFLTNAVIIGDNKTQFFWHVADWVESWSQISDFCLSKQTAKALIKTLRAQAMLIDELLECDYNFVLTSRFQSDPIERRFSQYRQMSGGRFLVSLREVLTSERILICRSLLKEDINFWEDDLLVRHEMDCTNLGITLSHYENEIFDLSLSKDSEDVAYTIAGYVSKKLIKRFKCGACQVLMIEQDENQPPNEYFKSLSRGGLTIPSQYINNFVCNCFAILDYADKFIEKHNEVSTRVAAEYVLKTYASNEIFTCEKHTESGRRFAAKIIVNIFFNNKQKLAADSVRESEVKAFKTRQRLKKKVE